MPAADAWVELQVELAEPAAEVVAAELSDWLGGVELRDAETIFPTAPDRAAVVALCRPEQVDEVLAQLEQVLQTARAGGGAVDPVTIRRRPAHEDEWRDVWKQFFRTTAIGRRFVVQPSWDRGPVPPAAQVIQLDPGRAFGTGAHPSTRLIIAGIERLADQRPPPHSVLDLGCGSGILTIAARRLWPAARALAADLDPEAVACTRENLARNGIEGVQVQLASIGVEPAQAASIGVEPGQAASVGVEPAQAAGADARARPAAELTEAGDIGGRFDLILANIQRDVLEALAPAFPSRLAAGGRLLLSGLLLPDLPPVRARFEAVGLAFLAQQTEGEWGSLLFAPDAEPATRSKRRPG